MTSAPSQDNYRRFVARHVRSTVETKQAHEQTQALTISGALLAMALVAASYLADTTGAAIITTVVGLATALAVLGGLATIADRTGPLGWRIWWLPTGLLVLSSLRLLLLLLA